MKGEHVDLPKSTELAPGIHLYAGALPNPQRIIDAAMARPEEWTESLLGRGAVKPSARKSFSFQMESFDPEWEEVRRVVHAAAEDYNQFYEANWDGSFDRLAMIRYLKGVGFFVLHHDDGPNFPRAFSILIYLNDVVEGGETEFTALGVSVRPMAGDLVVFPAQPPYRHQARVPTVGEKFVIATFCPRARWARTSTC